MHLYPFELNLLSLRSRDFPFRDWLASKEEAYENLILITGQDFGDDVRKWAEWGLANTKITHLRKRYARATLDIPASISVAKWLAQAQPEATAT